ncbi:MAG: 3-isopropylmalate dehydrogenase [Candidatus Dadabacteria bacterium]|nr:3-isopropylmalate dehydrogenase [Candidatus Dadabacteria bacterium]NIT13909.1 3-isopropylmalate dehydrogenase [Candidatus Dadabacteria bacterium]
MPKVLLLPGDGIGAEVTNESIKILNFLNDREKLGLEFEEALFGGACLDVHNVPITDETIDSARNADAVLMGAVGGPKWDELPHEIRPERGLLRIRKELDAFANLRPAVVFGPLKNASTLKNEIVDGVDIMVVRELTGGIYFGTPRGIEDINENEKKGTNTLSYTTSEIKRIARVAFEIAEKRNKHVTSVDKANVLEVMQLWRDTVTEVKVTEFPEIELEHLYVDNAAMQLIRRPKSFDVILAGNMFGDIISDEAAQLTGSLGMLPSASIGTHGAIYEPVHGSAPDIAGQNLANPIASILTSAMMLKYSLDLDALSNKIHGSVDSVLNKGFRTGDIFEEGTKKISCSEMGDLILEDLKASN